MKPKVDSLTKQTDKSLRKKKEEKTLPISGISDMTYDYVKTI